MVAGGAGRSAVPGVRPERFEEAMRRILQLQLSRARLLAEHRLASAGCCLAWSALTCTRRDAPVPRAI